AQETNQCGYDHGHARDHERAADPGRDQQRIEGVARSRAAARRRRRLPMLRELLHHHPCDDENRTSAKHSQRSAPDLLAGRPIAGYSASAASSATAPAAVNRYGRLRPETPRASIKPRSSSREIAPYNVPGPSVTPANDAMSCSNA